MLRSLNSGVSAMQQFQGELDVIGNNIANSNTTGYKSARVEALSLMPKCALRIRTFGQWATL